MKSSGLPSDRESVAIHTSKRSTALIIIAVAFFVLAAELLFSNGDALRLAFSGCKYEELKLSGDGDENQSGVIIYPNSSKLAFTVKNSSVRSVYISLSDGDAVGIATVGVFRGETEIYNTSVRFDQSKRFIYLPLSSDGVTAITVDLSGVNRVEITSVVLNRAKNFGFNILRFLIVYAAAVLLTLFFRSGLHCMVFNRNSAKHKTLLLSAIILSLSVTAVLSAAGSENMMIKYPFEKAVTEYGCYPQQFDAFVKGRLDLDLGYDDSLLASLDNPYNPYERNNAGVYDKPIWDRAYYNGSFYSYFGVAPVLVLYFPCYLMTGTIPSDNTAAFVFCAAAAVFLSLALIEISLRYIKKPPLFFLFAAIVALPFATLMLPVALTANFYHIAVASGMAFFSAFLFFIFKAVGAKGKKRKLFFVLAGLAVALTAASRPNMIFLGIIAIPLLLSVLFRREGGMRSLIGDILSLIMPVVIGAVALMWYNAARFSSPFDFGSAYQITVADTSRYSVRLSLLGAAATHYLFQQPVFDGVFPFIHMCNLRLPDYGGIFYTSESVGLFALPASAGIFGALSDLHGNRERNGFFACAAAGIMLLAFLDCCLAGVHLRYEADIAFVAFLAGAVGMCVFLSRMDRRRTLYSVVFAVCLLLLAASATVGAALTLDNEIDLILCNSPRFYAFLMQMLS